METISVHLIACTCRSLSSQSIVSFVSFAISCHTDNCAFSLAVEYDRLTVDFICLPIDLWPFLCVGRRVGKCCVVERSERDQRWTQKEGSNLHTHTHTHTQTQHISLMFYCNCDDSMTVKIFYATLSTPFASHLLCLLLILRFVYFKTFFHVCLVYDLL